MPIKLAVFDIAGTTLDDGYAVHESLIYAMTYNNYPITREDANAVMGIPKPVAISMLLQRFGVDDSSLVEAIHGDFLHHMQEWYQVSEYFEKPHCSRVFEQLKENGVIVAVNTGFDRNTTNIVLEKMGWLKNGLISDSITSDEVVNGRPAADMIIELMRRSGIDDAKDVAKIGDTPSDISEGKNAGCGLVIGITHGSHTLEQLENFGADAYCESLDHVLNTIMSHTESI